MNENENQYIQWDTNALIQLSEILELPSISKFEFIDMDKTITGGAIDSREVKDGYLYFF